MTPTPLAAVRLLTRALYWSVLIRAGLRRERPLLALPGILRQGDIVVDAGADVGVWTAAMSRLVGPKGKVVSFEPYADSFQVLARIVRFLGLLNVSLEPLALGDVSGDVHLLTPLAASGKPMPPYSRVIRSVQDLAPNTRSRPTRMTTLQQYALDHQLGRIAFIKVDIEGYELPMLRTAESLLRRDRPALLLEIESQHTNHYGYPPEELVEFLTALGYSMFTVLGGGALCAAPCVTLAERDYVFLHSAGMRSDPSRMTTGAIT
jgi:FkbM family methyltransferase